MHILVTGGCGFIGSNLVNKFLESEYKVRVIDNLSTGNKNNIAEFLYHPNFEFVYGDITNLEICRKVVKDIDVICHQAAVGSVPRSVKDPLTTHNSNVNGFLNILLAAKENNIKRIVYASSSSVYGDEKELPKIESKTGNVLSPYAATKSVNEIYAQVFSRCYDMECIGLRYFNVFGPKQNPNGCYAAVIPKFISLINSEIRPIINGDGSYSRDFTYIDNIVQANLLALNTTNELCFGQVFNIGANGRTTILELFNTIKKHLKSDIKPKFGKNREGDIPHSNADVSKAIKLLNYNPKVSFEEGIIKTIEYYNPKTDAFT